MLLTELRIENFRMFGEGKNALVLPVRPGLTALIGENDAGKTAVIDALRLALGTRDQEMIRIDEDDFHQASDGSRSAEIRIRCKFEKLTRQQLATFLEHLTYEDENGTRVPVLYVNWKATETARGTSQRRSMTFETRSGKAGDGPQIDRECRAFLRSTYLRPLRDAERELASGRGSRLSQILQNTKEVKEYGEDYDPEKGPPKELAKLSVLGIGRLADELLSNHEGIQAARKRLNDQFLKPLSFSGSPLEGHISVSGSRGDASSRLRQLLEKLDLELRNGTGESIPPNHGLGSNNLLFMACELLLLGSEEDGFPLLLIEEPEAHLHPQRQLRLMQFLQESVSQRYLAEQTGDPKGHGIQIIVTTHSPNLASAIDLDNLVLLHEGKAYSLAFGNTKLDKSDYGFLRRFLDVTKANLFFARGVMIVEGDAENILLPTIAELLGRDFTEYGVSIVNVGGTGLRRFARIFQRKDPERDGMISIPVACVADFDVMPDCAPEIIGKVKADEGWPTRSSRRWLAKRDLTEDMLRERRDAIRKRASGQCVETFVADQWTLEYDLAFFGLAKEVWAAAHLAQADDQISTGKTSLECVICEASRAFEDLLDQGLSKEELASRVYAPFVLDSSISKATAAQYLAHLLQERQRKEPLPPDGWRSILPPYLVGAIDYVTGTTSNGVGGGEEGALHA